MQSLCAAVSSEGGCNDSISQSTETLQGGKEETAKEHEIEC